MNQKFNITVSNFETPKNGASSKMTVLSHKSDFHGMSKFSKKNI